MNNNQILSSIEDRIKRIQKYAPFAGEVNGYQLKSIENTKNSYNLIFNDKLCENLIINPVDNIDFQYWFVSVLDETYLAPHTHNSDEYLICIKGSLYLPEKGVRLVKGQGIFIPAEEIHSFYIEAETEYIILFVPGWDIEYV